MKGIRNDFAGFIIVNVNVLIYPGIQKSIGPAIISFIMNGCQKF